MVELFANSGDPDQTPHFAASDQGLHCLLVTRLGVSSLQWVNEQSDVGLKFTLLDTFFTLQVPLPEQFNQ